MLSLESSWKTKTVGSEQMTHVSIKSEVKEVDALEIDELDMIPLKDRLKMLVSSSEIGSSGDGGGGGGGDGIGVVDLSSVAVAIDVVVKKEEGPCSSSLDVVLDQTSLELDFTVEGKEVEPCEEQDHLDNIGERNCAGFASISSRVECGTKTHADDLSCSNLVAYPEDKVDFVGMMKLEANDKVTCVQKVDEGFESKNETGGDVGTDDLDHIPLGGRRRTQSSRVSVETIDQVSSLAPSNLMTVLSHCNCMSIKEENQHVAENDFYSTSQSLTSEPSQSLVPDSSISKVGAACSLPPYIPSSSNFGEVLSPKPCISGGVQENERDLLTVITTVKSEPEVGNLFAPINHDGTPVSDFRTFPAKIKIENFEEGSASFGDNNMGMLSSYSKLLLKSEQLVYHESSVDILDHLTLLQRMKLLIPEKCLSLPDAGDLKCTRKTMHSTLKSSSAVSESQTTRDIKSRRKRKRTATDSVETALQEDAPGLLKVLMDKGITIDEMKLYGDPESADTLDASSDEDSFQDLEVVMSKIFDTGASVFKFALEKCTKGSKRSYCLGCLISLVEQTRYLRFRKWPVEWGWCRDLQSFIFVFERHNRIVLERPEYGYATYFFELVDSLTIDWQIKRLVTAMKLSSCGRANLLENKSLLVGQDLTEAEAKVLEGYGWTPNSGLATMLNYCDRVIHDRNKDRDVSEWRSKIGKLLVDGINGGVIVLPNLPNKFVGPESSPAPEIKLEI